MRALKETVPRPFTFGPIRFANLNSDPAMPKKPLTYDEATGVQVKEI